MIRPVVIALALLFNVTLAVSAVQPNGYICCCEGPACPVNQIGSINGVKFYCPSGSNGLSLSGTCSSSSCRMYQDCSNIPLSTITTSTPTTRTPTTRTPTAPPSTPTAQAPVSSPTTKMPGGSASGASSSGSNGAQTVGVAYTALAVAGGVAAIGLL